MSATEATEQKTDNTHAVEEEYEKLERFHVEGQRIVLIDKNHKSEGGFGIVRRAKLYHSAYLPAWLDSRLHGPPQLLAVKQIKVSDFTTMSRAKRAFTREMLVWSSLEAHPGIAKFIGFYADFDNSKAWLLSPWEPNGNVSQFIKEHNLEVPEKLSLVYDTIDALNFLHQLDPPVCHGDIKAANVLVSAEYKGRLCDFGLARLHEDSGFGRLETSTGMKGSIRWCSPEILQDAPRAPTSDVYAWAWLVWEIMTGDLPYEGTTADYAIMCKIFESTLPHVDGASRLSECLQVWELMLRCWNTEPGQRPTAKMCKTTIGYLPRCTPTPANSDRQIRRAELLENLGDLEIWKGNLQQSSIYLDEALLLYQEEADLRGIASVLRKQAVTAYRNDDRATAREKATAALDSFKNLNDPLGVADASLWLGRSLGMRSNPDEALLVLEESLNIYRMHENDVGIAHCLERIGWIHNYQEDEEKALVALNEAVTVASRSGDRLGVARALRSLASVHNSQGAHNDALATYSEASRIARSIGWELGMLDCLGRMVVIHMLLEDYTEAEKLIRESISIAQQGGLRRLLAASFWELGKYFHERSNFKDAAAALTESCLLYEQLSLREMWKHAASALVDVKRSQGDWNRALYWLNRVIAVSRGPKDQEQALAQLLEKGEILAEAHRYDEAALHFEAVIATCREKGYSWPSERQQMCAIPKTVVRWESRLPLLDDGKKLLRRQPQLFTASLKLPISPSYKEI